MSAGISSPGVGSGLDVEGLVKQLVQAEAAPPTQRLNRQEQRHEQELSALGQFKSALGDFQGSISGLSDFDNFSARTAQSSDPETVDVRADRDAEEGRYSVNVEQLASSHKLVTQGGAIQAADEPLGTGNLTFQFGSYGEDGSFQLNEERGATALTITSENNTVRGVRDAINDADIGVRANVVNDGQGPRLVMTSTETGAENSIRITADNAQGGLERLTTDAGGGMQQLEAARDAVASIDGVPVRSATNELSDAVDGVQFALTGEGRADVEVAMDRDEARNTIGGFVEGYNQLMQTVNKLTEWDAEAERGGPLNGDSTVRMVVSRLQQTISTPVEGLDGPYQSLADLGFQTNKDGTLSVDQARLNQAIDEDMEAVGHLFARSGEAADPLVNYVDSGRDTEPGNYMVDVDSQPSRGQMLGNPVAQGPVGIDESNDSLVVSVDGITSEELRLSHGQYGSLAEVAAELQSQLNGDPNLSQFGASVSVDVTEDNRLSLTSEGWGAGSTVGIREVADNTGATLGLAVGDGIPGEDVQGRIGGIEARGSGRELIAEAGPAEGLRVNIQGGETGQRGLVNFSRGFGEELKGHVDSFMDRQGSLSSREESLNNRLDEVADRREQLQNRLERLEDRYRSEFSRLDGMLGEMQQTQQFLQQRLGSMPGGGGGAMPG